MSITTSQHPAGSSALPKATWQSLLEKKRALQPIVALTAYDYPTGRLVDEAGVDLVLVGDSLAMVVLGHESTLEITVDEMLHHARAVRRGVKRALLIADMPYGSYHSSPDDAVNNAVRFLKEAGVEAVKIEGPRAALTRRLTDAEVPVVGHLGLTPQSVHKMSGYRVQARTLSAADALVADALALEEAGAVAVVLEGVPREVAARVTAGLSVPTIGIGAGPGCDGQILVLHDLVNLSFSKPAKFVRQYGDAAEAIRSAVGAYAADVRAGSFPSEAESYHLSAETLAVFRGLKRA